MISILLASSVSLLIVLVGTPIAIKFLRQRKFGQYIREDGPESHFPKEGTPTMGGLVIIGGSILGYLAGHLRSGRGAIFSASGLLAMGTIVAMGALGFIDDYLKVTKRRSLGLSKSAKLAGQLVIALAFAAVAGETQASSDVSFIRPLGPVSLDLGILFMAWVFIIISAATNGVNLADGLDGLACGSGTLVMGAYVMITFWQVRHSCDLTSTGGCYDAPHSLDLAMVSASMMGAAAGFLWWNAAPAKIFMGDTGSFALGGAMGAMAILTNTQLLLIVLGGLYVVEVTSVLVQVAAFRLFNRRLFLMAPIHHHFELIGWPEFTVIVRFWILAGLSVVFGLGLFYAEFLTHGGAG
ncbi:MAG: phospho-N-acetylmuramoyl-pentapeptide-transferase [Actinomycetota bacterium]